MSTRLKSTAGYPNGDIATELKVIESKIGAMRFGAVHVVIHEGRVTQIESTEKIRFAPKAVSARGILKTEE